MDHPAFPIFLFLENRPCLVVGGGQIAREKTKGLLASGARVTVVAPRIVPVLEGLETGGKLRLIRRTFESSDLEEQALVIAATDVPHVQQVVSEAARQAGVLCNVVDRPALCDFIFGAIHRRGDLQVVVSTGGRFPLLASRLRDRVARLFPEQSADAVEELGLAREMVRRRVTGDIPLLRQILGQLVTPEVLDLIERGDVNTIRERIKLWNYSLTL